MIINWSFLNPKSEVKPRINWGFFKNVAPKQDGTLGSHAGIYNSRGVYKMVIYKACPLKIAQANFICLGLFNGSVYVTTKDAGERWYGSGDSNRSFNSKSIVKDILENVYGDAEYSFRIRKIIFRPVKDEDDVWEIVPIEQVFGEPSSKESMKVCPPGKKNKIPSLDEVRSYFISKGASSDLADTFYSYYNEPMKDKGESVWKDSKGNTVKSWKQKAIAVWLNKDNGKFKYTQQKKQDLETLTIRIRKEYLDRLRALSFANRSISQREIIESALDMYFERNKSTLANAQDLFNQKP